MLTLAPCSCTDDHQEIIRARIDVVGDCWVWKLRINRDGYGALRHKGHSRSAHRVSYEAFRGPIPPGLTLDHLCRNRRCVNPDHLEPVTNGENIRRGYVARGFVLKPRRIGPKRPYRSRANVGPDDPRHGTRSGYINLRCKCEPCRSANREYRQLRASEKRGVA